MISLFSYKIIYLQDTRKIALIMHPESKRYFDQGLHYQEIGDFQAAADSFKKVTQKEPNHAEAWYLAGLSFLKLKRKAEGGMYLRRALKEYEDQVLQQPEDAQVLYFKACTLAWLTEKDLALKALEACLSLDPNYASQLAGEEAFVNYTEDKEFLVKLEAMEQDPTDSLVDPTDLVDEPALAEALEIEEVSPISEDEQEVEETVDMLEDTPEDNAPKESIFEKYLANHHWTIDRYLNSDDTQSASTDAPPTDWANAPSLLAQYPHNERLNISMSYQCQEHTILLELKSKRNKEEEQAYRIYKKDTIEELLEEIVAYQDQIHEDNWMEFIGVLVDVCDSLLFEMPDGRTVKIA